MLLWHYFAGQITLTFSCGCRVPVTYEYREVHEKPWTKIRYRSEDLQHCLKHQNSEPEEEALMNALFTAFEKTRNECSNLADFLDLFDEVCLNCELPAK